MITHSDVIQVRADGPSGTIMLNRAARRNALGGGMIEKFEQALSDLHQEKSVRAVIITGSGDYFSSGTDLKELQEKSQAENSMEIWHEDCSRFCDLLEQLLRFPKPIIAALNGPVLGSAAALMLASDIVIASDQAWLQFPESLRGLVPGMTAPLLSFRAGAGQAARMMMTANRYEAAQMLELGIYHEIVAPDVVWARANELSKEIEACSPQSLLLTKRLLNETIGEHLFTALHVGAANTAAARITEAATEGVEAFLDGRQPEW